MVISSVIGLNRALDSRAKKNSVDLVGDSPGVVFIPGKHKQGILGKVLFLHEGLNEALGPVRRVSKIGIYSMCE